MNEPLLELGRVMLLPLRDAAARDPSTRSQSQQTYQQSSHFQILSQPGVRDRTRRRGWTPGPLAGSPLDAPGRHGPLPSAHRPAFLPQHPPAPGHLGKAGGEIGIVP